MQKTTVNDKRIVPGTSPEEQAQFDRITEHEGEVVAVVMTTLLMAGVVGERVAIVFDTLKNLALLNEAAHKVKQ